MCTDETSHDSSMGELYGNRMKIGSTGYINRSAVNKGVDTEQPFKQPIIDYFSKI